jgi:hypothetical protein
MDDDSAFSLADFDRYIEEHGVAVPGRSAALAMESLS